MSRRLAIPDVDGRGKVVADTAIEPSCDALTFFYDGANAARSVLGWALSGGSDALRALLDGSAATLVAIGNNSVRLAKARELIAAGATAASVIHPSAHVARDVKIGGTVVLAGAVAQPGSSLGSAVIFNTGVTVNYDCVRGDGAHVCPGASVAGCVSVCECAGLCIGCLVRQALAIGANSVVGGEAAVVAAVADRATVVPGPSDEGGLTTC
jgi:sugar O-acyltransferase (sialic acid O-acetyltransferase NeuD family)